MKRRKPKTENKKLFLPPLSQTAQMRNFLLQMPVPALLSSLETTVSILTEKGIEIKDWEDKDNKDRYLVQFRQLGGKCYFFAQRKER